MWDGFLFWLAKAEDVYTVIRVLGLSKLAAGLLHQRGGFVRQGGFEFFPDRNTLNRVHGTLADRFAHVSSVSAIWVVGSKFYHAQTNAGVVKRLLLPNPDGDIIKYHAGTVEHAMTMTLIREATELARTSGAKVRWYDNFIFHSIILADVDEPSGWIHVESVLPYSKPEMRPSYTVYKRQSDAVVRETARIFSEIWDHAKEAPG
jgi:hypothetical protein